MIVLGIESTAHTFGVGLVTDEPEVKILANVRDTYVPPKGGMKPGDLARHHAEVAAEVTRTALERAEVSIKDVDSIAVALGPGMGPALRVGAVVARGLALKYGKPLVPVNHGVAHIEIGMFATKSIDPLILYLSGGNTIIATYYEGRYRVFGETLDVALGNMMDAFVREIGLAPPYVRNGMHVIDICAEGGKNLLDLPYVVKGNDMSFSGLLTAALRLKDKVNIHDLCYSVREYAFDMLLEATERALALTGKKEILVVGGVAASVSLKGKLEALAKDRGVELKVVPPEYAGDNGAMIAYTGLLAFKSGQKVDPEKAMVRPRWRIDQVEIGWR